jgi:hypothetical protein
MLQITKMASEGRFSSILIFTDDGDPWNRKVFRGRGRRERDDRADRFFGQGREVVQDLLYGGPFRQAGQHRAYGHPG